MPSTGWTTSRDHDSAPTYTIANTRVLRYRRRASRSSGRPMRATSPSPSAAGAATHSEARRAGVVTPDAYTTRNPVRRVFTRSTTSSWGRRARSQRLGVVSHFGDRCHQMLIPRIASLVNEPCRGLRRSPVVATGDARQRTQIDDVLRPELVVAREQFERDQVAGRRDWHAVPENGEPFGLFHDLVLDPRARE